MYTPHYLTVFVIATDVALLNHQLFVGDPRFGLFDLRVEVENVLCLF